MLVVPPVSSGSAQSKTGNKRAFHTTRYCARRKPWIPQSPTTEKRRWNPSNNKISCKEERHGISGQRGQGGIGTSPNPPKKKILPARKEGITRWQPKVADKASKERAVDNSVSNEEVPQ